MNSNTKLAAKRIRSPSTSSSSVSAPLDLLARTTQEMIPSRELDQYFSEPTVARRAEVVARAAREQLGEIDSAAPGERPNRTKQAFRCYQKAMRIILAEYLEHEGLSFRTDMMTHAAQGAHEKRNDGGRSSSGACTAAAYVLASENLGSFVELMRRLDNNSALSHCANSRAQSNNRDPDHPLRDGTPAQPPPLDWSSSVVGGRPSFRLTGDPARHGAELLPSNVKREPAAQPPMKTPGLSLPRCPSRGGTDGRGGGDRAGLRPSAPSMPAPSDEATDPADSASAAAARVRSPSGGNKMPLVTAASCRDERTGREGWLTNDPRCWVELDDRTPWYEAEGQGKTRLRLHGKDALPRGAPPATERPSDRRSSETFSVEQNRLARVVDSFQQADRGAFDGGWLRARGWFVDADSVDWVSVSAASGATAGDIDGAGGNRMDMSSTFGTDNAVASPRHLLDEHNGDFALGSSLKESKTSSNGSGCAPSFHFSPSEWSARRYTSDCKPYGRFEDAGDGDDCDEKVCDGSEEFFPEPDACDPADGGLPCLSRRPRDAWGPAV
eukprot:g18432.t1